jgi:8-oxo-dGTP pyrophosphatase MutT (NUDIX family)
MNDSQVPSREFPDDILFAPPYPTDEPEQGGTRVGPWIQQSVTVPYRNEWIQVEHHEVLDPSGTPGIYGVVRFQHLALGCVPVHADGTVTLVGQHRYPLNQYSWEIPEGGGSFEADPLQEMQRELEEETGLRARTWIPLGKLHTSNSVCDEVAHLWLARDLEEGDSHPDSTEMLEIRRVPLVQAVSWALGGQITDAITIAALLRAAHHMRSL